MGLCQSNVNLTRSNSIGMKIKSFAIDINLALLDAALGAEGIPHRIIENQGQQELWIQYENHKGRTLQLIDAFEAGQIKLQRVSKESINPGKVGWSIHTSIIGCPFTLITLALGVAGYWLGTYYQDSGILRLLLFGSLTESIGHLQLWRLITPVYIHFGWMHILFNGLWIFDLGRRLELLLGTRKCAALFFLIAIGSNFVQYIIDTETAMFGGLSGVVYGYLGFLWIASSKSRVKNQLLQIPPGIFVFMFAWLILGFLGVIDLFINGRVANGAHLGGLLIGVCYGLIYFHRLNSKEKVEFE